MKKVVSIFAVLVMSVGLFSCENDNSLAEDQALYENLEVQANDEVKSDTDGRD